MTYQFIINRVKEIIEAHPFINTYGYGNLSDIAVPDNEQAPNYPYAFINPTFTNLYSKQFEATFNLIVMTQVPDKEDDELFGQSNCMKYINDILSQFVLTTNDPLLSVTFPVNMTPFKERFQDDVVGATATVTIKYGSTMSVCDSPITSITPSTPYCPQTLVIDGDNTQHYLDAGDSYTCLPATFKSGIFYQRVIPWDGYDHSATEGSVEWHRKQGTYNYTPPSNPLRIALLADNYAATDAGCLLQQSNVFGNNFRFTNDIGQQYVENFNQSAGNTSPNPQICIDHLTGLMVYVWDYTGQNPLNLNWVNSVAYANNFTYGGHSDWRLASLNEYIALISNYLTSNAWPTMYAPWVDPDVRNFGGSFWLGSADLTDPGSAHTFVTNGPTIAEAALTITRSYPFMVRNFYK